MLFEHPKLLFVVAILLMVFGVVMPFLMVLKLVESTFFLNFLSYGSQILGFFLGVVSLAAYRVKQKKKDDNGDQYK
jgi:positive regulator of sigma E activity